MPIQKNWTAYDISKDEQITIIPLGGDIIRFQQSAMFLDKNGNKISDLKTLQGTKIDVAWGSLPANIQTALIDMQNFLHGINLAKYNMTDSEV